MNLEHWGFRRWPFEHSFAADRFYCSPTHDEAMARLLFLVEEFRRTGVVIGPAGTGKSYLLRLMLDRAERLGRLTARCDVTATDGQELARQVAQGCLVQCDLDGSLAQIWTGIQTRFAALRLVQQPLVVVLDHFDSVDFSCYQTVRRIRHVADATGLKLTLILVTNGRTVPPGLQDVVDLRVELSPWSLTDVSQFITFALTQSGVSLAIFTDEALVSVFRLTSGNPSKVVTLCNLILLAAMEQNESVVTSEFAEAVAHEMFPIAASLPAIQRSTVADSDLVFQS